MRLEYSFICITTIYGTFFYYWYCGFNYFTYRSCMAYRKDQWSDKICKKLVVRNRLIYHVALCCPWIFHGMTHVLHRFGTFGNASNSPDDAQYPWSFGYLTHWCSGYTIDSPISNCVFISNHGTVCCIVYHLVTWICLWYAQHSQISLTHDRRRIDSPF